MTFLATRLPDDVAPAFRVVADDSVEIAMASGGAEFRNAVRSQFLRRYRADFNGKTDAQKKTLLDHWYAVGGRLYGFLLKDWMDYSVSSGEGVLTALGGGTYQMYRRYTRGALTHDRIIYKPLSGTITVAGGGSYSVSYSTGVITHSSGAAPTGWTGEFDVPVRFDMQGPGVTVLTRDVFDWGDITLRELTLET